MTVTTHYGSLVGAIKQSAVYQQVDSAYESAVDQVIVRDTITLAAAPVNDLVQVAVNIGWDSILDPDGCKVHWAALGGGSELSFGDLNYPAALDAAFATNAAGSQTLLSAIGIGSYYQPLWQQLGFASLAAAQAISQQATLVFTVLGAAATGVVTWQLKGQLRE